MMGALKPYPDYTKINAEWLCEMPKHWKIVHGSSVLRKKREKNYGMIEDTVLSLSYGKIVVKPPEKLHGLVPESFETYQIVDPHDIIIRPIDLQNDWVTIRVAISYKRGIITSAYICMQAHKPITCEYAYYLLLSYDLQKVFYGMGSGLRQNLDWSDFKRLPMLLPPKDEQNQITRYLDSKLVKINKFIRNKKQLIELLKEQKHAVINQAVTKGLDPDAKMKPSSIEWLGDMPEGWVVKRLSIFANIVLSGLDKKSYEDQATVKLCNYVDVYKNDYVNGKIDFMTATAKKNEIEKYRLQKGDIIITKDSETWDDIAVPAMVTEKIENVLCGYHLALIRNNDNNISCDYLFYSFKSYYITYQYKIKAKGVTRFGLSYQHIHDTVFVLPTLKEQTRIALFIKREIENIDQAIDRINKEIKLITEYRTSLISAVVTGKVDVRGIEVEGVPDDDTIELEIEDVEELDLHEDENLKSEVS